MSLPLHPPPGISVPTSTSPETLQLSPLTDWVVGEHEGRFSTDPLPVFFLQEAVASISRIGRDVRSLVLSIQHFLSRPRCQSPSKVPRRMAFERLSWRITCPNHASCCLLTVARRGSCGPTTKLLLLRTLSLVLCSK